MIGKFVEGWTSREELMQLSDEQLCRRILEPMVCNLRVQLREALERSEATHVAIRLTVVVPDHDGECGP